MKTHKSAEVQSYWLWIMCLTGVDYFSTLGYQPSIAFEAVGLLAPLATVVLVAVTLGCALPVYWNVAAGSPHGQGSIAMLERLLHGWLGKILVLVLLGFVATDFVVTKTLSSADAAAHLLYNPYWNYAPEFLQSQIAVTMFLLVLLGGMFLRGFREVIVVAVTIVGLYLVLNVLVIGSGLWYLATHSEEVSAWYAAVQQGNWQFEAAPTGSHGWWTIGGVCLLYFPKLALGLSGFETGVAMMPLVKGAVDDDPQRPEGRIRATRKLLVTAALIMSLFLLGSAIVTSMLIDPSQLISGGDAENRALAYLAHGEATVTVNTVFGKNFGTLYDVSTILILWFAGASAMSGLLNLIPSYLPRYGMAPRWAEASKPLVLLFTAVNLLVTLLFRADVAAQGGAYATGVMVLMTSASIAVVIERWKASVTVLEQSIVTTVSEQSIVTDQDFLQDWEFVDTTDAPPSKSFWQLTGKVPWLYVFITFVFTYTTVAIVLEKPDGIKIAGGFILATLVFSMVSRTQRSTELRFEKFEFVDEQSRVLWDTLKMLEFPVLVPHRPGRTAIVKKERIIRRIHRLGEDVPIVFIEASLGDTSEFSQTPLMAILQNDDRFVIHVSRCVSVAHVIAAIALELSKLHKPPELHFSWSEANPLAANLNFVLFGEGNVPWLVRELVIKAEPNAKRRPRVIIG